PDLYSLGCMLHALLAGQPPFVGAGLGLLRMHVEEKPAPLRSLASDVPASLEALVLRLLEKRPEDRPPTAQRVADELDAIVRSPDKPRPRRSGLSLALLALAVALVVIVALIAARRGSGAGPEPPSPGSTGSGP